LTVLDRYLATPRELVLAGPEDTDAWRALYRVASIRYEPYLLIARADPDDAEIAELITITAKRPAQDGQPTAYLCERRACLPPVTAPADLAIQLDQGTGITWEEV
jgi:uncharacterized protein YyaL (SSP411 family)